MNLRTIKSIRDNYFVVQISTLKFRESDLDLIRAFGDPDVDVGGNFAGDEEGDPEYDLPLATKPLKDGFQPYHEQRFDFEQFDDAERRAEIYILEMNSRISTALASLRTNQTAFERYSSEAERTVIIGD